ncbi:hypothetical protein AB0E86_19405 [Streptomyces narbonensis]
MGLVRCARHRHDSADSAARCCDADEILLKQAVRELRGHGLILGPVRRRALPALTDPAVAPALKAVHDDPGHPWTVESLGTRAGTPLSAIEQRTRYTSEFAFAKAFKRRFGSPPAAYRQQVRTAGDEQADTTDGVEWKFQQFQWKLEAEALIERRASAPSRSAEPTPLFRCGGSARGTARRPRDSCPRSSRS